MITIYTHSFFSWFYLLLLTWGVITAKTKFQEMGLAGTKLMLSQTISSFSYLWAEKELVMREIPLIFF